MGGAKIEDKTRKQGRNRTLRTPEKGGDGGEF